MKPGAIALAAVALAAAALALTPRTGHYKAPQLAFVTPQPNAKLMLARVPISLHLREAQPHGEYAILLDGHLAAAGGITPVVRFLPPSPLAPGTHRATAYVFGPGFAWDYAWRFSVNRGAQKSVRLWAASSRAALADVNAYRALGGERPMRLDLSLEGAARAHSRFFYRNLARYGSDLTVSVHQEQPSWPGYVGRSPYSRDVAFGFNGDGDSEVMAFGVPIGEGVKLWIDSIYHRFGLLDPGLVDMGYGISGRPSESRDLPVTTIDAGYLASAEVPDKTGVLWPARGLVGIPLAFEGGEIPDPLQNFPGASYPAGYPVTISFFGQRVEALRIASAALTAGGARVPAYLLTPRNERNKAELGMNAALIPSSPLKANQVYEASFRGSYQDPAGWHSFSYTWSFSTAPVPALSRAVFVPVAGGGKLPGRVAAGIAYVRAGSMLSAAGGTLAWSAQNPDFATAIYGGKRLRFSRRSFYATLDGRPVRLAHVPLGGGPNPRVPAQEFARLLGLRADVAAGAAHAG